MGGGVGPRGPQGPNSGGGQRPPTTGGDPNATDPSRAVDDPSNPVWRRTVNTNLITVIRYLNDPTGKISNDEYQGALSYLVKAQEQFPDQYGEIADDVTGFIEASGGSVPGEDGTNISDLLNQILGGGGPSSTSSTTNTTQKTKSTSGQVSESGSITRQRVYVDVPTADEFLDNFQTGYRAYLDDQRASGALSGLGYELALASEDVLLDEYLGDLGARAARGEQIFETVGASGDPRKVGERIGQISERGEVGGSRTTENERTSGRSTETGTVTSPGGGAGGGGGGFTNDNQFNRDATTDQDRVFQDKQKSATIEDIFERPNLALVKAFSPLDFLKGKFGEGQLETFLRARKGTRQRVNETAQGAPVIQARRT